VAYKNGCPTADVLKPTLNADGGTSFSFDGSGVWHDTGWFCRYAPAARNPMGWRLDVYHKKPESPGKVQPASGPYAFPEFGPGLLLRPAAKRMLLTTGSPRISRAKVRTTTRRSWSSKPPET
jgi:hypothetical protein